MNGRIITGGQKLQRRNYALPPEIWASRCSVFDVVVALPRWFYPCESIVLRWAARLGALALVATASAQAPFRHPGILHSQEDLERMKSMVQQGREPWASGFEKLKTHPESSAEWRVRGPFKRVVRAPGGSLNRNEMDADANAAYQEALMWCITGNEAYARKSVEILDAWSQELQSLEGHDVELLAGLDGFKFANAAELIRWTWPQWERRRIEACAGMLTNVFLPRVRNFATFANGNWDGACIKTLMAIGVFCDDRALFERAVEYFYNGKGNGRLTHYIINEAGQCQESGRDQAHAQLGLGQLAEACQVGWNQGRDMFGAAQNRLLGGFEYTGKYNLGQEVPFVAHTDTTGENKAVEISAARRGRLRPIYEMVWNHYQVRQGMEAPYTREAAEKLRPEGAAPYADHPGFGTLLFTLPPSLRPPAGTAEPLRAAGTNSAGPER